MHSSEKSQLEDFCAPIGLYKHVFISHEPCSFSFFIKALWVFLLCGKECSTSHFPLRRNAITDGFFQNNLFDFELCCFGKLCDTSDQCGWLYVELNAVCREAIICVILKSMLYVVMSCLERNECWLDEYDVNYYVTWTVLYVSVRMVIFKSSTRHFYI